MFDFDQRNHDDHELIKYLSHIAEKKINNDLVRSVERQLAVKATNHLKRYNKKYYDKKHLKPSLYKEGDYVMIRDTTVKPGENRKFKAKYKGPYMVDKVLNKNRYVVKDIPDFPMSNRPYNSNLSTDRMKPWVKPISKS